MDLAPLNGLNLNDLTVRSPGLSSLQGLDSLPNIRELSLGSALTDLDPFALVGPAGRSDRKPLDANGLAVVQRLCAAHWSVAWDTGPPGQSTVSSCGSPCLFSACD